MATIEESVEVDVPVRRAYDQWTQFETLPAFMEGVKEVRQLDDTHLQTTRTCTGWSSTTAGNTSSTRRSPSSSPMRVWRGGRPTGSRMRASLRSIGSTTTTAS